VIVYRLEFLLTKNEGCWRYFQREILGCSSTCKSCECAYNNTIGDSTKGFIVIWRQDIKINKYRQRPVDMNHYDTFYSLLMRHHGFLEFMYKNNDVHGYLIKTSQWCSIFTYSVYQRTKTLTYFVDLLFV